MWELLAMLVLLAFFLLWRYHAAEGEETALDITPQSEGPGTSVSQANAAESGGTASTARSITYELTRWDLFQNHVTIVFRNRLVQAIILAGICLIEGTVLRTYYGAPLGYLLNACFGALCHLLCWMGPMLVLLSLAQSFLFRQRGVVGQHVLEITDRGLIERTDYNENLAKWASIRRLHSTRRYLYIYVSDFNFYAVPKQCFARKEIAGFEAELRACAKRGRELPRVAP